MHQLPTSSPAAITKSLFACFTIESMLYAKALVVDLKSAALDYKVGFGSTGIFLGLRLRMVLLFLQPLTKNSLKPFGPSAGAVAAGGKVLRIKGDHSFVRVVVLPWWLVRCSCTRSYLTGTWLQ